jgi:CHAT domain-containing protein/tetratricopeptide (TPR) repeat protein
MLVAFVALAACRDSSIEGQPTPSLPRAFEARVSDQVAFRPCGSPGARRGPLEPVRCASSGGDLAAPDPSARLPSWRELKSEGISREGLAAVARLLALAPTERNLRNALEVLRSGGDLDAGARETALGAVYHALAQSTGDDALLVDALEHTELALERAPSSDAARFNRALIEGDLGLCRRARESWAEYLARASSPWAGEARARKAALPCGDSEPPAEESDRLFEEAVEDLLPRWAAARLREPDQAPALLRRIEGLGQRLEREAHDPWLSVLVRQLRQSDPGQVSAVRDYLHGRGLFESARYREAALPLRRARAGLPADSVLIPWCDLWIAGTRLSAGDFEEAERILESHRQSLLVAKSPLLGGRIAWALGLAAARAGRLEAAHDRYAEARELLETGGYRLSAAWVGTLEADVLAELGFVSESWRPRCGALRELQGHPDRPALHNGLLGAADAAAEMGDPRAAHAFVSEAAALAQESELPLDGAEAFLTRGDIFLRQGGQDQRAGEAFRRAIDASRSVVDPLTRSRLQARAHLGLWDSHQDLQGRPTADLDRVIRYFAERGPAWREIQALRVKARVLALRGDSSSAETALEEAIGRIREVQAEIGDEPLSFRHWESLQEVFDQAIALALDSHRPLSALALLEEARRPVGSPVQALPVASCSPTAEPSGASPSGDDSSPVTVVYGAVGDRLVWWRIDGDRCRFGAARQAEVRSAVDEVVERAPARGLQREPLERLYRELLSEPLQGLAPSRPLIVIPDRYLLRLPFAALVNPETGRHLVEERALSLRPGLLDDRRREPRAASPNPSRWRALVVGDPAFDRSALPWLPRLAGAEREARQVASLYRRRATLLTGREATAARIGEELARSQVLHLAAHAVPGADGMRDVLVLADDPENGSSGLVSSQALVRPGRLPLDLVVLSACSTLGKTPSRSGGLVGLARPFVARGTSAVVGTLWPLDDRVLTPIMIHFHEGLLAGLSASESLRRAQVAALDAEPRAGCCDWAGIQLVGEIQPDDTAGRSPASP